MSDEKNNGQAVIKWTYIPPSGKCPELSMFNDSWFMFPHLKSFFEYLENNNNKNLTPEDIIEELEKLGIKKASHSD